MASLELTIVSPEGELYSGKVDMVLAPGIDGQLGILPNHAPLITQLATGELRVRVGEEEYYFVSGGMIEILPHQVTVLADTAIRAKDVDEAAAIEAKNRAEQTLKDRVGGEEYARAAAELAAAVAQLHTLQRLRARTGIKG